MGHRREGLQGRSEARWAPAALLALLLAVAVALPARTAPTAGAQVAVGPPLAAPVPLDCTDWRYGPADEPASLPAELDRDDYRRSSLRDPRPELFDSPHELCGQKGSAVDLALGVSRGRPDVVVAVLDSGIRWQSAGAMADLATEVRVDLAEAPTPCLPAVPDGDCDGDGRITVADHAPVADRNGNGVADPQDLILDPALNDGVDDDGDGYVDDIAGWDLLYGDNDPFDTVDYGHGTGEALDSVAAEGGGGDVGTCPGCSLLPVRVGDSFIADGGRFAAGVLYGLDQGADVIQEALGALTNPTQAQAAIDAAYARGVVVVASMADEASQHPNLPGTLERTLAVNSVTEKDLGPVSSTVQGYLALNGCTNLGGRTDVSVPSSACSSEATGLSAGMVALAESVARDVDLPPHPSLAGQPGADPEDRLSAEEVMQLVHRTADDVDFATPNAVDPANEYGTPSGAVLFDTVRYPSRPGWDAVHGWGRINAYELVRAVGEGRIPPEARIDGPQWFDVLPATGTVPVTGRVAAERADAFDWRVEWAPGLQPPAWPATDAWTAIGGAVGATAPVDGTLATLDLAAVAAALPGGGTGPPADPSDGRPDPDRFAARLRVVVTQHGGDGDGLQAVGRKQVHVHDDPDLVAGHPARVAGAGTASPLFVDLDGDGADELVLGTDDGWVHAWRSDGAEVAGYPVRTPASPWWPMGSPTAAADGIGVHHGAVMVGGPAVGDLDRDGDRELVVADLDGGLSIFAHDGAPVAAVGIDPAYSLDDPAARDEHNRAKPGFGAAPALGDLDGDGDLEVVAAALDRHVYAWHHDGAAVAGFPVLVVDPATVAAVDPTSHAVTFLPGAGADEGGELLTTPALADLDGDGRAEIVIGGQEQYREPPNVGDGADVVGLLALAGTSGNGRVHVLSPDGAGATTSPPSAVHPHANAELPGWPVAVAMAQTNSLPTVGDGVAMPAAIGDVAPGRPGLEVVAGSATGPVNVLGADGAPVYGATASGDLTVRWAAGLDLSGAGTFGPARTSEDLAATFLAFGGPSLGDVDADGDLDVVAPTAGINRLLDVLLPDLQVAGDDQLSAWDGATGAPLASSPHATSDLAFFVAPAVADVDDDGTAEAIAGNGFQTLAAVDGTGAVPAGWPKLTGGWVVGTPAVGDWGGDGTVEVAQARRDGVLLVWRTAAGDPGAWSSWGCDAHHSGACADTSVAQVAPPPPPSSATTASSAVAPTSATSGLAPSSASSTPSGDEVAAGGDRGSGSGRLPLTGAQVGALVLVAAALVAAGAAVRRRARAVGRRPGPP